MTVTTYPLTTGRSPRSALIRRTVIGRTLTAEWTKLSTLRSTWRSVGAAMTIAIGLGAAIAASQVAQWSSMSAKMRHDFDPVATSLIGVLIAAVALGSVAVRSVTSEYSTGMIRTTFTALPGRRMVLAAKAVTAAALAFPVALIANVIGFEIGQRILASKHLDVSVTSSGSLRAIIVGAVAVSLMMVIGVGLGALIRRTAPAMTGLSLVLVGGAVFGQFLPASFRGYLPATATQGVVSSHPASGLLHPIPALLVLCGYAAVIFLAAAVRIGRHDA